MPITDWKSHYENTAWMLKIEPNTNNHLSKTSAADCFQIRSISKERFIKKVGELRKEEIQEIENIYTVPMALKTNTKNKTAG